MSFASSHYLYIIIKTNLKHLFKNIFNYINFVLYVPSDHRQHTVLWSIEQGWEGLPIKQDHRSNDPTNELQSTIGRSASQINHTLPHNGPSVDRSHR